MLTAICSIVKLISWKEVNLSHLYLKLSSSPDTEKAVFSRPGFWLLRGWPDFEHVNWPLWTIRADLAKSWNYNQNHLFSFRCTIIQSIVQQYNKISKNYKLRDLLLCFGCNYRQDKWQKQNMQPRNSLTQWSRLLPLDYTLPCRWITHCLEWVIMSTFLGVR